MVSVRVQYLCVLRGKDGKFDEKLFTNAVRMAETTETILSSYGLLGKKLYVLLLQVVLQHYLSSTTTFYLRLTVVQNQYKIVRNSPDSFDDPISETKS